MSEMQFFYCTSHFFNLYSSVFISLSILKDMLQITPKEIILPSFTCALVSFTYTESTFRMVLDTSVTAFCIASSILFGELAMTSIRDRRLFYGHDHLLLYDRGRRLHGDHAHHDLHVLF